MAGVAVATNARRVRTAVAPVVAMQRANSEAMTAGAIKRASAGSSVRWIADRYKRSSRDLTVNGARARRVAIRLAMHGATKPASGSRRRPSARNGGMIAAPVIAPTGATIAKRNGLNGVIIAGMIA